MRLTALPGEPGDLHPHDQSGRSGHSARWSAEEIQAVANTLHARPRKTLGRRLPAEALGATYAEPGTVQSLQPTQGDSGWIKTIGGGRKLRYEGKPRKRACTILVTRSDETWQGPTSG